MFQGPRALRQSDLEIALSTSRKAFTKKTSRKAKAATSEYGHGPHLAAWSRHRGQDDYQVQDAISELSKILSRIGNIQSEDQYP